jgi:hypothetical protein
MSAIRNTPDTTSLFTDLIIIRASCLHTSPAPMVVTPALTATFPEQQLSLSFYRCSWTATARRSLDRLGSGHPPSGVEDIGTIADVLRRVAASG